MEKRMNPSIFEQYEVFKKMHPTKLEVMKELVEKMEGKPMKMAAPLLLEAANRLKKENLSFTPEESAVLIEILSKDMSPEEKAKVEMMKNVIRKKGRTPL